jgi:hypothetical protein
MSQVQLAEVSSDEIKTLYVALNILRTHRRLNPNQKENCKYIDIIDNEFSKASITRAGKDAFVIGYSNNDDNVREAFSHLGESFLLTGHTPGLDALRWITEVIGDIPTQLLDLDVNNIKMEMKKHFPDLD